MAPVVSGAKRQRGSVTVQAMMYIAIFVLIMVMSFEIWKVLSIKQSLRAATVQAARYITVNGLWLERTGKRELLETTVRDLIKRELHNNPFLPADSDPVIEIHIFHTGGENCCEGRTFHLSVKLAYTVQIPHFGSVPTSELLTLQQDKSGPFRCHSYQ